MIDLTHIIVYLRDLFWGPAMIILLLLTGTVLQFQLKFMPLKHIWAGIKRIWISRTHAKRSDAPGEISSYAALMTGLASTIGTGNIIGVASAIAIGGPGSVFWLWCTAITGISIKYAEVFLSVHFRRHENGQSFGGPMYVIYDGMKKHWHWLGYMFSIATLLAGLGTGAMTQTNSISDALHHTFSIPTWTSSLVVATLAGFVFMGNIRRIGTVAAFMVPFMCISYIGMGIAILVVNHTQIPHAFYTIFQYAFQPTAAVGGFTGASVIATIRFGVARGIFCNEAGTGTAAMAQAAGKTNDAVNSGMIGMMGVFIDTMVICTMTALVVLVTGTWKSGDTGSQLFSHAVSSSLPHFGVYLLDADIVVFAFTTILGWNYYVTRAWHFLFKGKNIFIIQVIFLIFVVIGGISRIDVVWTFADLCNALMVIPNLIAIIYFMPMIKKTTLDYLAKNKESTGLD